MRRKSLSPKASRRNFANGSRVKSRNYSSNPMRGGIRL